MLRPNAGRLPWWLLDRNRRVPDTKTLDYLEPLKLAFAAKKATVAGSFDRASTLYRRLWQPLAVSALNTQAEEGSARLFWAIFRKTLGAGGAACVPLVPKEGLSESLIDPAIVFLASRGGTVALQRRLTRLVFDGGAVRGLVFGDTVEAVDPATPVVLAVPAPIATGLVPHLDAPTEHRAILNLHYKAETPRREPSFIGIVGGTAEWAFQKDGILSVTISAADRLIDEPPESVAQTVWQDLRRVYPVPEPLPQWRMVKEKRATFAATPGQENRRPKLGTRWQNLYLAGDWTATGLPGTIEGSIYSGHAAVSVILKNT
jgi:squalene-associated FAD-dependent desaturase